MIPETLQEYRKLKGLTIEALAKEIGLSVGYTTWLVQKRCRPSVRTAERISQITGVPVEGIIWPERYEKKEKDDPIKDPKKEG